MTNRSRIRALLGIDPPERDRDFPCPSRDFTPGTPDGERETDGHYMCAECVHANPETLAEREEMCRR